MRRGFSSSRDVTGSAGGEKGQNSDSSIIREIVKCLPARAREVAFPGSRPHTNVVASSSTESPFLTKRASTGGPEPMLPVDLRPPGSAPSGGKRKSHGE